FFVMFFFFQAEDGIRDRNVTGVQTCALPICAGTERSARGPAWWFTSDGHSLTDLASDEATGGFDWSGLHRILDAMPSGRWTTYEIGRASCRERGERWEGVGVVEEKIEEQPGT